jgi:threonine 3-dehydrogenase
MKAIFKPKPEQGLALGESPIPEIGPSEVLIKVRAAGICGTDLHIYNWDQWSRNRIRPPVIIGHEFVGEVVAAGKMVSQVEIGQRVSAEGHITCGHCAYCRTGRGHICKDVEIIGVDRNGCFAEYISINASNLWPVPDEIPDHHAAIFDPLGNAMHTVMAEPVGGKSLLITGAGAIGLFSVAVARYAGASQIIVLEPNAHKREIAQRVGADLALDPGDKNIEREVLARSDGLGVEVLLEMSGNPSAIEQGLHLLRNGACACVLGIPSDRILIDWGREVIFKGITIKGINGRMMFDTWYQSQNFMLKKYEPVDLLITHRIPFDEFERGFELLKSGEAIKVVLEMNNQSG